MKKYLISAALCAMMFGTGCQNEVVVNDCASEEFTLTLDMGAGSRTVMGENGCQWGDNESLYVVGDGGNVYGTLTMVWKSADGKSAMFSGKITGDASKLEHMVYPVPNEDNQIPMNVLNGANHNAPMVGSIANGEVTGLGYVGGLVKVKVNGEVGENKVTLEAVEGEDANGVNSVVAGYYEFNPETGALEYKQYEDGKGENSTVAVTNIPENGIIYLPVDTDATKENTETITVSLTIGDEDPVVAQVEVAENGATVSGENSFPMVNYDETVGVVSSKIANLDDLKKALKIGGEYELTSDIEATEVLKISKDITIKGDDHSVTSTAKYVFEITASKVNVVMNRLKMVNNAEKATNDGGYLAGIKVDPNLEGVGLALETCSVSFDNEENGSEWAYAVNVAGSTQHCGITIIGGVYEGANVINVWGNNHGIHIENATLTSLYQPNEKFYGACIRIEDIIEYLETFGSTFNGVNAKHISVADGKYIGRSIGSGDVIAAAPVVAKVDNEWCYSLEEAATRKGQIELFGDVTLSSDIVINSSILVKRGIEASVDLKGFDITAPTTDVFEVQGTLTINGNMESKVQAGLNERKTEIGSICAVWAYNGGTVNINGGHYVTVADMDGKRNDCIYTGGKNKTAGFVNIHGGKFEFDSTNIAPDHIGQNEYDGDQFLLNGKDNQGSKITVYGGEFKNHVPGIEAVAPQGQEEVLVSVESGKKVYVKGTDTEVTVAHTDNKDVWYEVR